MSDVSEQLHEEGADTADRGHDSLAAAATAGPPIDWDDEHQTADAPPRTVAANEADPLHSIYGPPPGDDRQGE